MEITQFSYGMLLWNLEKFCPPPSQGPDLYAGAELDDYISLSSNYLFQDAAPIGKAA